MIEIRGDGGRRLVLSRRSVTRETLIALDRYEDLLRLWQKRTNLVAPSTLGELWTRHFEEGLVLGGLVPVSARGIVDLGSGGGLPGLVLAILAKETGRRSVALVESNGKKAAFLRTVARELDLPCEIHAARIEACGPLIASANVVTARALASLDALLGFVAPHMSPEGLCLFPKGRAHVGEIEAATQHWRFTMVKHALSTEPGSVILAIRDVFRRTDG